MALKLICGPTSSGKTTRAIETFLEALARGERALFIAPSMPDARHFERQIIRRLGKSGPVEDAGGSGSRQDSSGVLTGGRVTTFDGLCREVLESAEPGARTISSNQRFLLLRVLVDSAPNLRVLDRSSQFDGFITALAGLFSEFSMAAIDSTAMAKKLRSWAKDNSWRQNLNKDLYSLFESYEELLREKGIYDHELSRRRAIALLGEDSSLLAYDSVIVDGFWDLTLIQYDLLRVIASAPRNLLVTLPYDAGRLAYQAPSLHLEPLEQILGKAEHFVDPMANSDRAAALDHLIENLFLEQPAAADAECAVGRLLAAGSRGQAEMVAAQVLKLFRSGHKLDEIAVVCRSLGPETAMMADVFEEFGIPFELSAPLNLAESVVGKTAAAALDFAAGSRSRASLMSYLRSPLSNVTSGQVDRFERKCRLQAIADADELVLEWRGRVLDEFAPLSQSVSAGSGAAGKALCDLVSGLMAEPGYVGSVSGEDLMLDLLSLKALREVCDETAAIRGVLGDSLTSDEKGDSCAMVCRLLLAGIARAEVRLPGGNTRGCVRILDPHRILNQRFDTVFICGLLEKQFPNFGHEDPFFSDVARRELSSRFDLPLDSRDARLAEERFLFFRTLSRARSKIFLCYPSCDSEGKPTNRSLFVDDVLELFEAETVARRERRISDITFAVDEAPTAGQALRSIAQNDAGADRDALIQTASPAGLAERLAFCLDASVPREPKIVEASVRENFGRLDDFRVTELQRYLSCPFIYFVESVLKPASFEPAARGLHRGQLVHNILCRFNGQLSRAKLYLHDARPPQIEVLRRQMARYIEEEFIDAGDDLDVVILRTELGFHLNRYIDREIACARRLEYYDVEISFGAGKSRCGGRNSTPKELVLGDFRLRGRLDRVDWTGDSNSAIVIDYKSGRNVISSAKFAESKEIQIPLYILALKEAFGMEPIGGEYFAIRGDKRGGLYLSGWEGELGAGCGEVNEKDFVDAGTFAARLDEARDLAIRAVDDIRQAAFPCEPSDKKRICGYCDYAGICRRQSIPYWMENDDE
ncbi:MAG: PD-(D/E)XK nuclease family protein [Actinobacteria bacterium]|nr:PD-(D/E)XK nuclease family protein [Actinomycetota bacterium]